ncbi:MULTISPECIES: HpsJ family protein [unclassified Coleofasciculus]|uniref:HpsJ family protein n=1 Tax=Cyanophyceae TaxID=3028117 RepID=UPI001A7E7FE5|nr:MULTISPECIES: HpsJ family protein [unclassified Coleofasciculus]
MKAANSRQPSSVASKILKLVGVILIVSSLVDYAVFLIPPNRPSGVDDPQWRLNFLQWQQGVTGQLIDRGVIPMVGLALLFAGYWIDNNSGVARKGWEDIVRIGALILSVILGLSFLLPVPLLNINSLRLLNQEAVARINQRATQVETQIASQSAQVTALLEDSKKLAELDQALKSGQVQGEQQARLQALKDQLQKLKQDPKALNAQVDAAKTQVRGGKLEAQKQAQGELLKTSIRNGLSSLLLAIGYLSIAALGLTGSGGSRRKAQAR